MKLFKNISTNKTLKVIVSFVFNIVSFIISKELGKDEDFNQEDFATAYNDNQSTSDAGAPSSNLTNDETPRSVNRHDHIT